MNRGDSQSAGLPPHGHSPDGGDSEPRPYHDLDAVAESALIDAALSGDMEAFAQLHEHYRPALYVFCLRRLRDASLAEDAIQEIFISALKTLSRFDRNKPFWPWLATVALRTCIDLRRRRSRTRTQSFGDIGLILDVEGNSLPEMLIDAIAEREWLEEALRDLPKRQRRALVLFALDGWSYADIASAEGISVGAVKLLLVRARRKMRLSYKSRTLPVLAFPFTWLREKTQRMQERVNMLLGASGERLSGAGMAAVSLSILSVIAITASDPVEPSKGSAAASPDEVVVPGMETRLSQAALQNPNVGASSKAPAQSQQPPPIGQAPESLVDDVINLNQSATLENTPPSSIAISPNYENDHTILALGSNSRGSVLFISRDGGANWDPLPSRLLLAHTIALPPGYPRDQRIFALGTLGLQQSDDGGETFRIVSPLYATTLAISPSFGKTDSRILVGGATVFEYDAATGVTKPAFLSMPCCGISSITFSPGYPSDPSVYVSRNNEDALLSRCEVSLCDVLRIPTVWPPVLRTSPRFDKDGRAYAFAGRELFLSDDGVRTFREVRFPTSGQNYIWDVMVLWDERGVDYAEPTILVATGRLYRSTDAGRSWSTSSRNNLVGLGHNGLGKLVVTPTKRLLAIGMFAGIACSEDLGQTWAPRCPPEPSVPPALP